MVKSKHDVGGALAVGAIAVVAIVVIGIGSHRWANLAPQTATIQGGVWHTLAGGTQEIARGAKVRLLQGKWTGAQEAAWAKELQDSTIRSHMLAGIKEMVKPELPDPALVKLSDQFLRQTYAGTGSTWGNDNTRSFLRFLDSHSVELGATAADIDAKYKLTVPASTELLTKDVFLVAEIDGKYWVKRVFRFDDNFDLNDQYFMPR